jgi:hypothetical protein
MRFLHLIRHIHKCWRPSGRNFALQSVQLASVSRETLLACSPRWPSSVSSCCSLPCLEELRPKLISQWPSGPSLTWSKGRARSSTIDSDAAYPASVAQSLSLRGRPGPSSDTESSRPLDSPFTAFRCKK